ncbi:MAG: redoxin domain-containing protein [Calditrichaceae bacterium]|jgi:peroxiredoxin
MKHIKLLSIFNLFSLILLFTCSSQKDSIEAGDKAPGFEAKDINGNSFSLSQLKGKKVLIHFWADWCSECRAEFPKLETAYQKFKNENFEMLAVNVGQSREHVRSFEKTFKLSFPMLLDEQSVIAKQYGIRGLPTNYFISEDQVVTKMVIGWVDAKQINKILHKGN